MACSSRYDDPFISNIYDWKINRSTIAATIPEFANSVGAAISSVFPYRKSFLILCTCIKTSSTSCNLMIVLDTIICLKVYAFKSSADTSPAASLQRHAYDPPSRLPSHPGCCSHGTAPVSENSGSAIPQRRSLFGYMRYGCPYQWRDRLSYPTDGHLGVKYGTCKKLSLPVPYHRYRSKLLHISRYVLYFLRRLMLRNNPYTIQRRLSGRFEYQSNPFVNITIVTDDYMRIYSYTG